MIVKISVVRADESIVEKAVEELENIYPFLDFEIIEEKLPIERAYDSFRDQYVASKIVRMSADGSFKVVVTSVDLYENPLNFVFGLAIPVLRTAVVSYFRLVGENLIVRLEKEIMHELGHLFGLDHCNNHCVMRFSNSVYEVDLKPVKFCEKCYSSLLRFLENFS